MRDRPDERRADAGDQLAGFGRAALWRGRAPSGDFVYAADFRGRIYGYRVNRADDAGGAVQPAAMINGQAITPAIDPQGRFLYVTTSRDTLMNSGDNSLYAYRSLPTAGR